WLVGTVGRLQTVKNQPLLARAFVRWLRDDPQAAVRARLVVVGDGPLRAEVEQVLEQGGVRHLAWLAGSREDVPDILRMLQCFVLPSQAEGTSCTLQEAMACGLPVVATAVGGTPDLVQDGVTGRLVTSDDEAALAQAMAECFRSAQQSRAFGEAARSVALARFGLDAMVAAYDGLFSQGRSVGGPAAVQPLPTGQH